MADVTDPTYVSDRAQLIVRMDRANYLALKVAAEQDGRSIAGLVRHLIQVHLEMHRSVRTLSAETLRRIEEAFGV